jgi:hypothetical protein
MGKLGARPDTEFCVHAGERPFNRPFREMKCRCHFLIRPSFRDQFGNALFGASEPTSRRRPAADASQLALRALRPATRAEVIEEALGLLESLARRTSLPCSPLYGSEDKQRARSFKREWKGRQFLQRLKDRADRGVLLAEAT